MTPSERASLAALLASAPPPGSGELPLLPPNGQPHGQPLSPSLNVPDSKATMSRAASAYGRTLGLGDGNAAANMRATSGAENALKAAAKSADSCSPKSPKRSGGLHGAVAALAEEKAAVVGLGVARLSVRGSPTGGDKTTQGSSGGGKSGPTLGSMKDKEGKENGKQLWARASFKVRKTAAHEGMGEEKKKIKISLLHTEEEAEEGEEEGSLNVAAREKKRKRSHWLIDPRSRFRQSWDMMLALWVLYICWGVPFALGFSWYKESDGQYALSVMLDIFFVSDIFLNFRTGYINNGFVIMDAKRIVRKYLKFWFWVDLLGSIPVELFFINDGGDEYAKSYAKSYDAKATRKSFKVRSGVAVEFRGGGGGRGGGIVWLDSLCKFCR
jgi:hypothetical protein